MNDLAANPRFRRGLTAAVVVLLVAALSQAGDGGSTQLETSGGGRATPTSSSSTTSAPPTTSTSRGIAAATTTAPPTTVRPTTTTPAPPPVCGAEDIDVRLEVVPSSAGPGQGIAMRITATNRSGRTCIAQERASWPRWDVNVDRPGSSDAIWGYAICQGAKEGNRHLATANADVPWANGATRSADTSWDQRTCAGEQAPPGTYRVKAYWAPAAEQPAAFSPDVDLELQD